MIFYCKVFRPKDFFLFSFVLMDFRSVGRCPGKFNAFSFSVLFATFVLILLWRCLENICSNSMGTSVSIYLCSFQKSKMNSLNVFVRLSHIFQSTWIHDIKLQMKVLEIAVVMIIFLFCWVKSSRWISF